MNHPIIRKDLSSLTREQLAGYIADFFAMKAHYAHRIVNMAYGSIIDESGCFRVNFNVIRDSLSDVSNQGNVWCDVLKAQKVGSHIRLHLSCGHRIFRRMKGREMGKKEGGKCETPKKSLCAECKGRLSHVG